MENTKKSLRARSSKLIREFSAGGAVFKRGNNNFSWLIIKPKDTDRWQLPKGKIEKGESSQFAAMREVKEEGGVKVKVLDKIGSSSFFFVLKGEKIFKTVAYFLMEWVNDTKKGHDWEVDEAKFFPFDEASKKLTFKDDKNILKKAKTLLDQGIQENLV